MKVSDFFTAASRSAKSLLKAAVLSRPVPRPPRCAKPGGSVVILGNGPSLSDTIAADGSLIREMPSMAVNFMANTPQFAELRPDYYVLADPLFFDGTAHENVARLWRNLAAADWDIVLCVPRNMMKKAKKTLGHAPHVTLVPFNFVGAEGFAFIEDFLYGTRLAMPRPRNVLIPAVMTAIAAGYTHIYICGADHSWLETIRVSDENHVISVQPHFYADSAKELKRSETLYRGLHLHDVLLSFYIAFRAYHRIARFAGRRKVAVFNSTPGSYIDAFPRRPLPQSPAK